MRIHSGAFAWPLGILFVAAAGEATARLDDWAFRDTPLLHSADRQHDLLLYDRDCIRGRPNGRYGKFRLNRYGFRGPEIARVASPGSIRIMLLGASESFGLYETDGKEIAALLREHYAGAADHVEVVNAAVAGMNLVSLRVYWDHWANRFHPDIVLIYPSPQLYLDDDAPRAPAAYSEPPVPWFRSRFAMRLLDAVRQLEFVRSARARYAVWRDSRGRDPCWPFRTVPVDRLIQFHHDLDALAGDIAAGGGRPVLLTHPISAPADTEPRDLRALEGLRIFFPRAGPRIIQQFNAAADRLTRLIGVSHHWLVIDIAAGLSGRRELFADPMHFNDAGSAAADNLLESNLEPILNGTAH